MVSKMNESQKLARQSSQPQSLAKVVAVPLPPPATRYAAELSIDEELGLRNYWRSLRKHLWLIVGITLLCTTLTAIYMAMKPDTYEARARVQVDAERSSLVGTTTKADALLVNDPTYFSTQLQILSSSGLLQRVIRTLDLENNRAFLRPQQSRSVPENLLLMVGLGETGREVASHNATAGTSLAGAVAPPSARADLIEVTRLAPYVESLQGRLDVEPVKDNRLKVTETRLIDVRFTHPDPQIAAKIVNAIADTFVLTNLERKTEANTTTGDFLEKRVAELQTQIRSGEERLINYAKNNQILSLDATQNTVVERLAGLNRQLLEAENERKATEAAYRAALVPGASAALAEENGKEIADAETKLAEMRQRRAALLVDNTEEWPEVKEVNNQIMALESQVEDVRSRATSVVQTNLATRYRQAFAREQSLRAAFNQQRGETLTQNEAAINYRIIQQEIETSKKLLDGLLQRSKENELLLAGTSNNVHVVDYSIIPKKPIGPQRLLNVGLAMMLSLGFGVGLALVLDKMDHTVRSADDVERLLQSPVLATIPVANAVPTRFLHKAKGALQIRNNHNSSELLINADPRSPLAEAYKHLRTSILLSTAGGTLKTVLVTSSQPAEGKTTTSINIALSLAQTGARVLLIDADMRRPRLHTVFDLDNRRGLSTILASQRGAVEVFSAVKLHQPSGLDVLTAGPPPPNPAELTGSEQMRDLLALFQNVFAYVVIDSPPIGSFTDGVLISSMVDGTLMVVQARKSSRDRVRRSLMMLEDVGARILGVVLNKVDLHRYDDEYYYNHAYYAAESSTDDTIESDR